MDMAAIVVMAVGTSLIFWGSKRKYDRTNEFGMDRLPTYVGLLFAKTIDLVLLISGGTLLLSGAIFSILESPDSWWIIVSLPLLIWLLFIS